MGVGLMFSCVVMLEIRMQIIVTAFYVDDVYVNSILLLLLEELQLQC